MPVLTEWFKEQISPPNSAEAFYGSKHKGYIIWGYCFKDEKKRFRDGTYIRTSLIVEEGPEMAWVQTLNTRYELGKSKEPNENFDFDVVNDRLEKFKATL